MVKFHFTKAETTISTLFYGKVNSKTSNFTIQRGKSFPTPMLLTFCDWELLARIWKISKKIKNWGATTSVVPYYSATLSKQQSTKLLLYSDHRSKSLDFLPNQRFTYLFGRWAIYHEHAAHVTWGKRSCGDDLASCEGCSHFCIGNNKGLEDLQAIAPVAQFKEYHCDNGRNVQQVVKVCWRFTQVAAATAVLVPLLENSIGLLQP